MIQKLFNETQKDKGCIVNECHIHKDGYDFACLNEIILIDESNLFNRFDEKDIGKYASRHSISGGKNESVYNHYIYIHDSFIEALMALIPIDAIVSMKTQEELDKYCEEHDAW